MRREKDAFPFKRHRQDFCVRCLPGHTFLEELRVFSDGAIWLYVTIWDCRALSKVHPCSGRACSTFWQSLLAKHVKYSSWSAACKAAHGAVMPQAGVDFAQHCSIPRS